MSSDFEAFKAKYGGGFLNDAADDSDKLLHTVAWDAWQAAALAERERLQAALDAHATELQKAMAQAKTLGEKHNVITLGKIQILNDVAEAIRQGGAG